MCNHNSDHSQQKSDNAAARIEPTGRALRAEGKFHEIRGEPRGPIPGFALLNPGYFLITIMARSESDEAIRVAPLRWMAARSVSSGRASRGPIGAFAHPTLALTFMRFKITKSLAVILSYRLGN